MELLRHPSLEATMTVPLLEALSRPSPRAVPSGKKLRHTRHAVASCGSVPTLDSISEDKESLTDGNFDKDMAYAVRINPKAPLGDEAAVAALLVEDTEDEGIQATVARKETSYPSDGTVGGSNVTDYAQISSAFASRRGKNKNRGGSATKADVDNGNQ